MDMDISMDIHAKSVDMDMDMDGKFHIHGNPGHYALCLHCFEILSYILYPQPSEYKQMVYRKQLVTNNSKNGGYLVRILS